MTNHNDPGDETPKLKVGRVTFDRLNPTRIVPRRYADAHDGEPAAKVGQDTGLEGGRMTMFPTDDPLRKGGPFDDFDHDDAHKGGTPRKERKSNTKDTNPKDAVGIKKWRQYCTVPITIIWELGVALLEGARKYGRHNYRVSGVRASVYVDAAKGHIDQWWEGEDIDEESKLSHITKAMASLAVMRDAMIQGKFIDDRPPKTDLDKLRGELQEAVEDIFERHPEAVEAYLEGDQYIEGEDK